jgi:hydrogenase maturation protease
MSSVLIFAYGNPLRCDDGIAWRAAEELAPRLHSRDTEIRCLHQLTPELAEVVSRSSAVIFLDASCDGEPGTVVCEPVSLGHQGARFSHEMTPQKIVALCHQLYSVRPQAFAVSLIGQSFDFGESLSPAASQALPQFVAAVHELVVRLTKT